MSAYIDERPSGDQREAAIDARGKTFEPPREIVGDQDRVGRFRDVDERAVEIEEERHRLPRHPIRKRRREREAVPFVHRNKARSPECGGQPSTRSEEHTSELQSLMRISYAVFCLKKK